MTASPLLQLSGVQKRFGGIKALDRVDLTVRAGTVHALLGENGAGKSTLIKMIAGVHEPDAGDIFVDGVPVRIPDTATAESFGIATIHQELNLVPSMSVAENITLGRTPRRMGLVNRGEMRRIAQDALDRIGLRVDLDRTVASLGIAHQQLVEIAKALSVDARLLVLDEPTAALTSTETEHLFEILRSLKDRGVGMVFISHHLDEIAAVGDSVTVLRDGSFVDEVPADAPESQLVRLMVGRGIEKLYPRRAPETGLPRLEVRELSSQGRFDEVGFSVRAGEVVGLAGLIGAGRTEVLRAISGVDKYDTGQVLVDGAAVKGQDISAAVSAGIGHVPEDRKEQGLVLDLSVEDNLGLATLSRTSRGPLADLRGQRRRAREVTDQLQIKTDDVRKPVGSLSGGNQQKVVFGRWLLAGSGVLLLDEPTRGVDVGSKVEIYELINSLTSNGGAVLLASSELPEVLGISDRVLVMAGGRVAGELPSAEATQDAVMSLAVKEVEPTHVQ
ncbi:sugar ABC transporter ATP-binding protein [Actinopolyspora halophila]|uniref:sugar ABC transporter ATP-binding protein n=1 Tax=Actinopolyspora halophila TaxID=1850 RepID=UPI00036F4E43|nr:sugar ABC transporter ATP-binding protein [Actinopolyspora halophila]